MKIDLTRSKNLLAKKIAQNTFSAYEQLFGKADVKTNMDFMRFTQVLEHLKYIGADVCCKLQESFELLRHCEQPIVSLRNVATFLIALESIFMKSMNSTSPAHKKAAKKFGSIIEDKFCIESEQQVRKLANHFEVFIRYKEQ